MLEASSERRVGGEGAPLGGAKKNDNAWCCHGNSSLVSNVAGH